MQGLHAYPELPFDERGIFANVMSDHWVFFQGIFALHEEGQLDRQTYEDFLMWFACQVATPGGAAFWGELSPIATSEAAAAVNERLGRGGLVNILQLQGNRFDLET